MFVARNYTAFSHAATDYISVSDAKTHLRVTSSSDDTYIGGLIAMALDACGQYIGYSVRKGTAKYGFDGFTGQPALINPVNGLNIPSGNYLRINSRVLAVNSVSYVNDSQAITAFDSADWITAPNPMGLFSRNIFIENAPTSVTDDVIKYIVEITEGFELASATSVNPDTLFPASIKHAALLLVGQYYDNRMAITVGVQNHAINFGFQYLLDPYKISVIS
jgi:hypothetical protein